MKILNIVLTAALLIVSESVMARVTLYGDGGRTRLTIDDMNNPSDAFPGWKNSLAKSERGMSTNSYISPQNEVLYIDPTTKVTHRYVFKNHKYVEQPGGEKLLINMLNSFDVRYLIYIGDGADPKYVVLEAEDCPHCRVHEKKDKQPHLVLLGNAGSDQRKTRQQLVQQSAIYTCQSGKSWYDHMTTNLPLSTEACGNDSAWYGNQELIGLIGFFNPSKTMGTPSVNVVPMSIGGVWWKNMQHQLKVD